MATILGIETSCDETAVAIVEDGRRVGCNLVAAQLDLHAKYGGVVPELASRAHLEALDGLVAESLVQADCSPADIDAIAVTCGPGLIGALLIGVTAAKTLAWSWGKPLIGVNHIHAHAAGATIELNHDPWPAVTLVVSGGHTSLYRVTDYDQMHLLGRTTDDAAGEAFDKVASILGLGYPGGPVVDRRARSGSHAAISFPRARTSSGPFDFSFSGLKTAVLYHVHGPGRTRGGLEKLTPTAIDDICASFSAAVVDVLVDKTMAAVAKTGLDSVVVGGGVSANTMLRSRLQARCEAADYRLYLPALAYCTDNAAMVAALGYHLLVRGRVADLGLSAAANIPS